MNLRVTKESKRTEHHERRIKVWKLKEKEVKDEFQNILKKRILTNESQIGEEECGMV